MSEAFNIVKQRKQLQIEATVGVQLYKHGARFEVFLAQKLIKDFIICEKISKVSWLNDVYV